MDDETLQNLYSWVDQIPLSRPKRSFTRDFSDGVLIAEIIYHFFPKYIQLHNYSNANSTQQKLYNWNTLNQKGFKKLNFVVSKSQIENVVHCKPGAVENLLCKLQSKIVEFMKNQATKTEGSPSPVSSDFADPISDFTSYPLSHDLSRLNVSKDEFDDQRDPTLPGSTSLSDETSPYGKSQLSGTFKREGIPIYPNEEIENKGNEKDVVIEELRETIKIMDLKIQKLEQLVRLKDSKIQALVNKLQS